MPCPTCSATLQRLDGTYLWCSRCGTLVDASQPVGHHSVPVLVERCRRFNDFATHDGGTVAELRQAWRRLGIEEAINVPEDRNTPARKEPTP